MLTTSLINKNKNIIMKTKYLDNEIELLNAIKRNNELSDCGKEKLNEFNEIKQALTIPVVSQQREFLIGFREWMRLKHEDERPSNDIIDEYLKTN